MTPVLLWLSAVVAVWTFLSPSVLKGELPHHARERVVRHALRDPLIWSLLCLVVFAGLFSFNAGVAMMYDPEGQVWRLSSPFISCLPGSTADVGCRPLAVCVALLVTVLSARHALGGSARVAFLLLGSSVSGALALFLLLLSGGTGDQFGVLRLGAVGLASPAGVAFLLHLVCGVIALAAVFERKWMRTIPLFIMAIGGNLVGAFVFAGAFFQIVFAVVLVLTIGYSFAYLHFSGTKNGEYQFLAVTGIMLTAGAALGFLLLPDELVTGGLAGFTERVFLSSEYLKMKSVLSNVALRAWREHLWIGTGIGSIPFVIKFGVADADWAFVPSALSGLPNGWWQGLVESGLIGFVVLVSPVGFLCAAYFRRLACAISGGMLLVQPTAWIAPAFLLAVVALLFFDGTLVGAETVIVLGAACALSVSALPRGKKR